VAKFGEITQTEDPTQFPLASNLDGSVQQFMYKDENLDVSHDLSGDTVVKQQPNPLKSDAPALELIDKRRNFANVSIKYISSNRGWYTVNDYTQELVREITHTAELSSVRKRINNTMLQQTFASLNVFEKEIIVWIRLHHMEYLDKFNLISDIMHKFNIAETRINYLLDSSGV